LKELSENRSCRKIGYRYLSQKDNSKSQKFIPDLGDCMQVKNIYIMRHSFLKLKGRILALSSIAHFINDGSAYSYAVIYPYFVTNYNFSYLDITVVSVTYLSFSALSSLVVGRMADKSGRISQLLSLGIGLWGAAMLLLAFSVYFSHLGFLFLITSAIIGGIASAFYHPLGAALISRNFDVDKGTALGINGAMGALGRSTYPLLLPSLTYFATGMYLLSFPPFAIAFALPMLVKDTSYIKSNSQRRRVKFDKKLLKLMTLLVGIALIKGALPQGFITFLPTFLIKEAGLKYGFDIGLLTSLALIGSVISQPLLGKLSDSLGRMKTMMISTALGGITVILYVYLYQFILAEYILLFSFGLFAFEAFTLLLSYVSDLIPEDYVSTANSIVWGIGITAGGALGPAMVGIIASFYNILSAYLWLGLVDLVSLSFIILADRFKVTTSI